MEFQLNDRKVFVNSSMNEEYVRQNGTLLDRHKVDPAPTKNYDLFYLKDKDIFCKVVYWSKQFKNYVDFVQAPTEDEFYRATYLNTFISDFVEYQPESNFETVS